MTTHDGDSPSDPEVGPETQEIPVPRDESIVLCITGNGLKTLEAVADSVSTATEINTADARGTQPELPRDRCGTSTSWVALPRGATR